MVKLTQMNGNEIVINIDTIEVIEEVPHTIITTVTDKKIIVVESADEVIQKGIEYRRMARCAAD